MTALNWHDTGDEHYLAGSLEVFKPVTYWHVYAVSADGQRKRQDREGFHSAADAKAFAEGLIS